MHSLTVRTDWTMISQVGGAMISERWSRHRVGHQWEGVFVMQCRVLLSDDDMPDPLENAGSHCVSRAVRTLRTHPLNDHNLQMEGTAWWGASPRSCNSWWLLSTEGASIRKRPEQGLANQSLPTLHAACSTKKALLEHSPLAHGVATLIPQWHI